MSATVPAATAPSPATGIGSPGGGPGTTGGAPGTTGGARRRRRWPRVAVPFAVAVLVLVGTVVAHALQRPDPAALTPTGTGADGGSRLAALLRANGISIQQETTSRGALAAAARGDVTLFVPAPNLMNPDYLPMLTILPSSTRIVLVAPSTYTLDRANIPASDAGTRWATRPVEPGCALPEARRAGVAAVYRVHYQPVPDQTYLRCYRDALLGVRAGGTDIMLVGAIDPFRNDRIGEYGNQALATGLLSRRSRVVWLDLRHDEPPPGVVYGPAPSQVPGDDVPGTAGPPAQGQGQGGGDGGAGSTGGGTSPPLPVPVQFWAVAALLVAAALAIALARARRLGPPVAEPLPVTVRGLETVAGRGRLYQRARARGWALGTLRAAALRRLLPLLELGPDPAPPAVVGALAARTGRPPDEVHRVLYGPEPATDAGLVQAADELDALMRQAFPDIARGESR